MKIIEIVALDNGAHRNQTGGVSSIPDGWAVVPAELECKNFPFGDVEVETVDGVPTVAKWTPREIPVVEPIAPTPSAQDDTDAMMVDHEYRLTLLELGLVE